MKSSITGILIDQEIHVEPAPSPEDGWILKRGSQILSTSTDQGKVVDVCNIMRAEDCFACGVGDRCCFFPSCVA